MRKSIKALAVLSLFGLGLGSVTACGGQGSGKSIEISVNGTVVVDGGRATVDELSTFTLTATVEGGEEGDSILWSSNSPTALAFDKTTGSEVTATANTPSTTGWQVSAELEGDASVRSTISIIVNEVTKTYAVTVDTSNAKTNYNQGEAFTSQGLVVNKSLLANGEVVEGHNVEMGADEYTLSIADGTLLTGAGTIEVTVTPTDTTLQPGKFSITVAKDELYLLNMALNHYAETPDLELVTTSIEGEGEAASVVDSSIASVWGDYALEIDSTTKALYHSTENGIHKYEVGADKATQSYTLTDAGTLYDSYYPIVDDDPSVMFDINMVSSPRDLTSDLFINLTLVEEDPTQGVALYLASPSTTGASGIYEYVASRDIYYSLASVLSMADPTATTNYGIYVMAGPDYELDILSMFDTTSAYAAQLGYQNVAQTVMSLSEVPDDYIEAELQNLVENNKVSPRPATDATFKNVIDSIATGDFDAYFGDGSFFSDLNCEYHGNENYTAVVSNLVDYPNATQTSLGDPASISSEATIFFDAEGKTFDGVAFPQGTKTLQYTYESTQNEVKKDENGEFILIPDEYEPITDLKQSDLSAYDFGIEESSMAQILPSQWNGFFWVEGMDQDIYSYWDKNYSYSSHDETLGVDYVRGSYNLYGSLILKTSTGYISYDMLNALGNMSPYIGGFLEQYAPTYINCKVMLEYQLVENDWSNKNSYVRIYTYVSDGTSEDTIYQNLGYIDVMSITNIGNGSYEPAEQVLTHLTPAAQTEVAA